jgi:hypothetical protein
VVLAEQVLEDAGVGEKSPSDGLDGTRELCSVANTLEGEPELTERGFVGSFGEALGDSGEAAELPPGKHVERHVLDALGETRRPPQAGEHEAVLGTVERFEQRPATACQLLFEPLEDQFLGKVVGLFEAFELVPNVSEYDIEVAHRGGCLTEPSERLCERPVPGRFEIGARGAQDCARSPSRDSVPVQVFRVLADPDARIVGQ